MLELLPLLESPQDLFTPDQVYDLMNCLTELKMSKSGEKVSPFVLLFAMNTSVKMETLAGKIL